MNMALGDNLKNIRIISTGELCVISERKKRKEFYHVDAITVYVGSDRLTNNVLLLLKKD